MFKSVHMEKTRADFPLATAQRAAQIKGNSKAIWTLYSLNTVGTMARQGRPKFNNYLKFRSSQQHTNRIEVHRSLSQNTIMADPSASEPHSFTLLTPAPDTEFHTVTSIDLVISTFTPKQRHLPPSIVSQCQSS